MLWAEGWICLCSNHLGEIRQVLALRHLRVGLNHPLLPQYRRFQSVQFLWLWQFFVVARVWTLIDDVRKNIKNRWKHSQYTLWYLNLIVKVVER